jgi:hypothetical protein
MAKQARCEMCGRVAGLTRFDGLPARWVSVVERTAERFETVGSKPAVDLCGLPCVERWAAAERHARQDETGIALGAGADVGTIEVGEE